jgi:hypothetical protein
MLIDAYNHFAIAFLDSEPIEVPLFAGFSKLVRRE